MFNRAAKKIETKIEGFDEVSGGGLPKSSAIALVGSIDSRKELLIRNMVWNLLENDAQILYYSVSQSREELLYEMNLFGWDLLHYERKNRIRIVDVFSKAASKITPELNDPANFDPEGNISKISFHKSVYDLKIIYEEGIKFFPILSKASKNKICVFDSISPLIETNNKDVFQMMHTLKFATRLTKAIGIGIMHSGIHNINNEETFKSLADAIVEIKKSRRGNTRYVSIAKYPGEYQEGPFPIEFNSSGINVIPIQIPDLAS
ncbi:MAG: RAD55 family ATPase [Candidatus Bathyarchaeota archaeon]|jgi:circadian clock protein KaiC|nr:RAD55 family ATPase [Candidatus Bathyarchaeota archaeon]